MVIYNHKKEFIGIEQKDLKALNLANLAELLEEASDFADLFVKIPGYVHNFKYVHWIDFIGSADSIDENRAILSVKGRNFKTTIELQPLYLTEEPEKKAYGIILNGLRELTSEERESLMNGGMQLEETKVAEPTPMRTAPVEQPATQKHQKEEAVREVQVEPEQTVSEEKPLHLDLESPVSGEEKKEEEAPLEISLDDVSETPVEEIEYFVDEDDKFADYRYDPEAVAKELGLPADLVEEFVQDFIAQAREFKVELYEALDTGRIDNLRMLSHKLKGVAANLRMEDAFDALVTINTSDDIDLVKRTLDHFYMVILKKLAGEEVQAAVRPKSVSNQQEESHEDVVSLKLDEDEPLLEAPQEVVNGESSADEDEKIELVLDDESFDIEEKGEDEKLEAAESEKIELDLDFDRDDEVSLPALEEEEREEEKAFADIVEINEDKPEESISIDKNHIAGELGVDVSVYEELLGDYISDMYGGLAQLEEAVANDEKESANKLAIRLKGMSDNMHLGMIAAELEHFIKDETADKAALLRKIKAQIESIERI